MANPTLVTLTASSWTLVATNVTSGYIHKSSDITANIYHTHRNTGAAVPTDIPGAATSLALWMQGDGLEISNSEGIDVYLYSDKDCNVRVTV